jgi:hypothetical protein
MARKELGWKALSYAVGAVAALVTRQTLTLVWKGTRHEAPPTEPADRSIPWTRR